jgi:hypothetical protein
MKIHEVLESVIEMLVEGDRKPEPSKESLSKKQAWEDLWRNRTNILYEVSVSRRYHHKRQAYFQMLEDGTQVATILGGVVVAGVTISGSYPWIGGAISFVSALAFVLKYGDKRQLHKELAVESLKIMQEIKSCENKNLSEVLVKEWEKKYFDMSCREPPTLRTLAQQCEWEQCLEDGIANPNPPVSRICQLFMHFG